MAILIQNQGIEKAEKIYGSVTRACGEQKYTVQFDCGKVINCFLTLSI
jgi:hypothetical protein